MSKKDNGTISIRKDKTGTEVKDRALEMAKSDGRSLSGFIRWLIKKEHDSRNKL